MRDVWGELLAAHDRARDDDRRVAPAHLPRAAVLACSDARVPPSVVFDQPAGRLFVVRVAGNTAAPAAVAGLDYATESLGVSLIVVLGHTHCGAVAAAADGICDGHLRPITQPICALVDHLGTVDRHELTSRNVSATVEALTASDSPVGRLARAGAVEIRGAVYDLDRDRILPIPNPVLSINHSPKQETT